MSKEEYSGVHMYISRLNHSYFVEQSVVWFGVKNRTNHFYFFIYFYFYFFATGTWSAIFSESENTHTYKRHIGRQEVKNPSKILDLVTAGWFRPRRAFQRRSIKADPRLSVIRPWLTILCTPTLYLHSAPKRSNVKHTNSRSKTY